MKRLFVVAVLCLTAVLAKGQKLKESEIPGVVKAAFAKAYPAVKGARWEREKESYEVGFKKDNREASVVLDASGVVLEEEVEISKGDLPKAVQNALAKDYAKFMVKEAAKITTQGTITYEAEVENGHESYDLIFEATGKLVKKIKKGEKKEKD